MKYLAGYIVAVVGFYLFGLRHPAPDGEQLQLGLQALGTALLVTLPVCGLARLATAKLPMSGIITRRTTELALCFLLTAAYWGFWFPAEAATLRAPIRFWLQLTTMTWLNLFAPFIVCVAAIELVERRIRQQPTKPSDEDHKRLE